MTQTHYPRQILAPVEPEIMQISADAAANIFFYLLGAMQHDPDFRYWLAKAAEFEDLTLDSKPSPVVY